MCPPFPREFYLQPTIDVAQALLGAVIVRRLPDGETLTGVIVETEAYITDDPACHSYVGRTERNAVMFGPPGHAYVFLNYGIHQMFNAVCGPEGLAEAVLVRAIEPVDGISTMRSNRGGILNDYALTNGPGKLAQALLIHKSTDNGADLTDRHASLMIVPGVAPAEIVATTRIGITQGADKPWRFYIKGNRYVSRGRPSGGR